MKSTSRLNFHFSDEYHLFAEFHDRGYSNDAMHRLEHFRRSAQCTNVQPSVRSRFARSDRCDGRRSRRDRQSRDRFTSIDRLWTGDIEQSLVGGRFVWRRLRIGFCQFDLLVFEHGLHCSTVYRKCELRVHHQFDVHWRDSDDGCGVSLRGRNAELNICESFFFTSGATNMIGEGVFDFTLLY